jgi:hypothetical protein
MGGPHRELDPSSLVRAFPLVITPQEAENLGFTAQQRLWDTGRTSQWQAGRTLPAAPRGVGAKNRTPPPQCGAQLEPTLSH